jgi:hypothetical protein
MRNCFIPHAVGSGTKKGLAAQAAQSVPGHVSLGEIPRRAKGGVKAHVLLDHDDYLPRYVLITEARRSEMKMAAAFPLNPGSVIVMDRGYNDYTLFRK